MGTSGQGTWVTCTTIEEVVHRLGREVATSIRGHDPVGFFASLYRQVTVAVADAITDGRFEDGPRMSRFDAAFGNRYFDALDAWRAGRPCPASWRETFGLLGSRTAVIGQHLTLGVNAHINLDLAVAAARTAPGEAIHHLRTDYFLVNEILIGVLERLQQALDEISPWMGVLDTVGLRGDEALLGISIRSSRAQAWEQALALARQDGATQARTIAALDQRTLRIARAVARPALPMRPVLWLVRSRERLAVGPAVEHLDHATARFGSP